ncbi:MAG: hypothetical protein MRY79_04470 [Alphaproteobacteria bacterium]|nr:hypothetical protein [Alphaproteobacteria bacterium]
MNKQRFALSVIAGFVFIFAYEFLVHGILLLPTYETTPHLWRAPEEMGDYSIFMFAMQFLMSAVLCFIFTRNFEDKGIGEGARFGAMMGLLLGLAMFASYAWMPISIGLALGWLVTTFVEIVILGVIFSLLYKKA